MTIPKLPMPGDRLLERKTPQKQSSQYLDVIVVASVWGNDLPEYGKVFATCIFLTNEAPYYRVGQIEQVDDTDSWQPVSDWHAYYNINHAVAAFADSGGDV